MSILDTFYILFKSNAKDVKKDTEEAKKATNDFQTQLNNTDKTTADLGLSFSKLALAGVAALESVSSLTALKNAVLGSAEYNAEIEKQTRLTGENARELAIWDDALAQAGGSTGEFISWFSKLSAEYQAAGLGDKIKNIIPNLRELSSMFAKLDSQSAFSLGAKLGIPQDLVLLLRQGPQVLDQVLGQMGEIEKLTQQTAEQSQNFERSLKQIGIETRSSASFLIPIFELILKVVNAIGTIGNKVTGFLLNPLFDFFSGGKGKASSTLADASAYAAASPFNSPLGIRSNNPGNLRPGGREATYATMQEGLAAEQENLRRYGRRGINTLSGIGAAWAPPNENDTRAYIAGLSKSTGYGANQQLDLNDPAVVARIANAINAQEEGSSYGNLIGSDGSKNNVTIGAITINTQATDADGIASSLHNSLNQHFQTTIGSYDDGVAR